MGSLSSPGGAGSTIYEPQPIRDRPVGCIEDFHTARGGINPGDICVFVSVLSELYISPTYILNEDTQLVMRAIGVSHTACKDEFRRNLRSHSWSVFSFFLIYV